MPTTTTPHRTSPAPYLRTRPPPAERLDLAPAYRPLLELPTMTRVRMPYGGDAWLAVRYEHVREVMSCSHITRELVVPPEALPRRLPAPPPTGSIMTMDGAEHARLRRLVNKAFTARRVEAMRPNVQRLVDELLEEMARFIPTGAGSARAHIATSDVQLGGVTVRAGEGVVVDLGAANFDAAAFPDPYRLDLRREPNHHLAMGHSSHFCLGAQLARMELSITLTSLLRRFPGLRLAQPVEELEWNTTGLIRGLARLPVTW